MGRVRFEELVAEALDSLPEEFRRRMKNIAVLVRDVPPEQRERESKSPRPRSLPRTLILGQFIGTATTRKSLFDVPHGQDHVVLYQRNIEAICRTDDEVRHEVRQTLIHEVGHYFGMSE